MSLFGPHSYYMDNLTQSDHTTIDNNIIGGSETTLCPYLLPCGICTRTNQQCPKNSDKWTIDWWYNQPTCY